MQDAPARSSLRGDFFLLLLLVLCGTAVKSYVWFTSPVLTRDGVGFLEYASRLGQEPWKKVLRSTDQHPLYPFAVMGLAQGYELAQGQPLNCYDWELCAHLVNLCAGLLLIVPMYYVGKRLGSRSLGFGAALFFQVMPVPVRVTVDTLTEGSYLLFAAMAIWTALRGMESRRLPWLLTAGVCCGLAYLTRPEGALLPMGIVFTLFVLRWWQPAQFGWRHTAAAIACVSIATLCVVAPYWLTIGRFSSKLSVDILTSQAADLPRTEQNPRPQATTGGGILLASRFQPGVNGDDYEVTWLLVLREVVKELMKGFHYVMWLPAGVGMYLLIRRIRQAELDPGWLLPSLLFGGNFLILMWLGYRAHYVSERHTMLMVMVGCWPAMLGLQYAAEWLCKRKPQWQATPMQLQGFVTALLVGFCLVQALQPLHEHRLGHRYAGEWLKTRLREGDRLVDAYGWVSFYSGQRTPPRREPSTKKGRLFLVMEEGERDRLRQQIIEGVPEQRRNAGVAAFRYPISKNREVIVYEIPPKQRPADAAALPKQESHTPTATGTTSTPERN